MKKYLKILSALVDEDMLSKTVDPERGAVLSVDKQECILEFPDDTIPLQLESELKGEAITLEDGVASVSSVRYSPQVTPSPISKPRVPVEKKYLPDFQKRIL